MSSRAGRILSFGLIAVAAASILGASGEAIDTKRFPRLARLLLLPEESAMLKELKDEKDRREFQKIFWARRDPTPGTAANELEDAVRGVWARADELFSYPNEKGSETGCGQVLALLGRPEEIQGQEATSHFDNSQFSREGERQRETWIYRNRPNRPLQFTRGELKIEFDSSCRFAEGGILAQDLRKAAEALVVRPEVTYRRGPEGRLQPAGTEPGPAVLDLLSAPRADFPLGVETKLVARGPKGTVLVTGLVRVPAETPTPTRASLAFRAVDSAERTAASGARDSLLARAADGSAVASWGLALNPGHYRLTVAALLPDAGKASASTIEVDAPDLSGAKGLAVSPLVLYPDEATVAAGLQTDPREPYASFQVGSTRLRPRFGNLFTATDSVVVVATLHGAKLDPATQQASLRARFSILKDGRPVARGAEDTFATPDAVASVGPIPLAGYAPGTYVVRLEVNDAAAGRSLQQEASFEVAKP